MDQFLQNLNLENFDIQIFVAENLDLATFIGFAACFLTVMLFGFTILRARSRVRNINDVGPRMAAKNVGFFRRSMAGAIPAFSGEWEALDRDLKRAGFYSPNAIIEYLFARNFVSVGILVIGGALAVLAPPTTDLPKTILMITAGAAALAYLFPRIVLSMQAKSRLSRIQKGLPDALDIIRMCLTGGLPLRDSLYRVSREVELFHPDIGVELEVVRRHAEAGTMTKALKEFAKRMDTEDVSALATLVSQTERTGTYVATAITDFADSIRRQARQRAEERANKTSIKMLFPVILCLAPPVFILLLGPPVLEMRNFFRDAHQPGGVLDVNSFDENVPGS